MPKWTVLLKAGLYYENLPGYENKVKRIFMTCVNLQYVRKHLARRDSDFKPYKVEKTVKQKKSKKTAS